MPNPLNSREPSGPGVPEALPRTAQALVGHLGVARIDRLWVFPPRARGRRESGLIAASHLAGPIAETASDERRILVTAPYTAETTGKGTTLEYSLVEQGEAPADRFPRMMQGVVQRAGEAFGEPREVEIAGSDGRWQAWLGEFAPELLAPVAAAEAAPAAGTTPTSDTDRSVPLNGEAMP